MARTKPKVAADGLPEPLPVRPLFRPLAMVLGAIAGLAVVLFLQQGGTILLSTGWLVAGVVGGMLLGVLLPSIPYVLVARHVNSVVAGERQKRAQASGASEAPMVAPAPQAPQGGA